MPIKYKELVALDDDGHKIEVYCSDTYKKGSIIIAADSHGDISLDRETVEWLIRELQKHLEKGCIK